MDMDVKFHIHGNPGDKRRFQSKIAKFFNPCVFCAPAEGVPAWKWVPALGIERLE